MERSQLQPLKEDGIDIWISSLVVKQYQPLSQHYNLLGLHEGLWPNPTEKIKN